VLLFSSVMVMLKSLSQGISFLLTIMPHHRQKKPHSLSRAF
jgi:hypothetical protein